MVLAEYKTRVYPFLFALSFLGFGIGVAIYQSFIPDEKQDAAIYLALLFGGFWILLAATFANGYRRFTIYNDRFVIGPILYSDDEEIRFADIARWNVSKTVTINPSLRAEAHEGSRTSILTIQLKDGSVRNINMDEFVNWEEIRAQLRQLLSTS